MTADDKIDAALIAHIRSEKADDTELRESLRARGWLRHLPAIQDEHGLTLVGNRRLKLAGELGIEPAIERVVIGSGPDADAERVNLALASNIGAQPITPAERRSLAAYLKTKRAWTQQRIADVLGVSQMTISTDLKKAAALKETFNLSNAAADRKGEPEPSKPEPKAAPKPKAPTTPKQAPKPRTPTKMPEPVTEPDSRGRIAQIEIRFTGKRSMDDWNAFARMAAMEGKTAPAKVAEIIADYVATGSIGGVPLKELREKLTPIAQELETLGRKRAGLIGNAAVLSLSSQVERLLREWRESRRPAGAAPRRSDQSTAASESENHVPTD